MEVEVGFLGTEVLVTWIARWGWQRSAVMQVQRTFESALHLSAMRGG